MINKEILDKLSLDELYELKSWVFNSTKDEIDKDIFLACKRKKYRMANSPLNKEFDLVCMGEWKIFTIEELAVLFANGINNLDDLLKFDLNQLVGSSSSMREKFDYNRKFYNLAKYSDCIPTSKKK
jgi:hypothetical protein